MSQKKKVLLILGLVLSAVPCIIVIILCKTTSGPSKEPIPTPGTITLPGRLMLLAQPSGGEPAIYEFKQWNAGYFTNELGLEEWQQATVEPVLLYADLPWELLDGLRAAQNSAFLRSTYKGESEEYHHYVLDLLSGETIEIPVTTWISVSALSPDNRYLAFVADGEPHELSLLVLQTGEIASTLFSTECARYQGRYSRNELVCGMIENLFWLDAHTLLFSAYTGEMPDTLTPDPDGPGYLEMKINRTYLSDIVAGSQVDFYPTLPGLAIFDSGPTLVLNPGSGQAHQWLEASDVLDGRYTIFDVLPEIGEHENTYFAPDGQTLLHETLLLERGNPSIYELIDLRTRRTRSLENFSDSGCAPNQRLWAPDISAVMCASRTGSLIYMPFDGEPIDIDFGTWGTVIQVLAWLP